MFLCIERMAGLSLDFEGMKSRKVKKRERPAIAGGIPVRKEYLVFGQPCISSAAIKEVVRTLRSRWIGSGPKVAGFETAFAAYIGDRYAVAMSSCTAAMHIALKLLNLSPGDEVITTPLTFCATANVIIHAQGRPVFADIKRETMNIDPQRIIERVSPRTKVILPVHFAGLPADMDAIIKIARKCKLKVISDCAHAIESEIRGRKVGTMGDMAAYSFYANKNITTAEGGMLVTKTKKMAERARIMALHGLSADAWRRYSDSGFRFYNVIDAGFKYNMTDIQASLGMEQLKKIDELWLRRRKIWEKYRTAFKDIPVFPVPEPPKTSRHSYHLYPLLLDIEKLRISRNEFVRAMHEENIGTGVHYVPVHLHPYYRETFDYRRGMFPNAEWVGERTVSLPLSPWLKNKDVEDVITAVRRILSYFTI